jgi:P-type Cu+ transporter
LYLEYENNSHRKEINLMAIDPVCGMEVKEEFAAATSKYKGKTYYFCAQGCKNAFDKDPEKFLEHKEDLSGHGYH